LIICVRLVPNTSGVLKRVQELEDVPTTVVFGLKTSISVLVVRVVLLKFEVAEVVQQAGSLVIRITPEPT
jgi:hypothetical protein